MPRKYELTWDKTAKRWIKTIEGKKHYFEKAQRKTDHDAYLKSLDAYRELVGLTRSRAVQIKTSKRRAKSGSYKYLATSIAGVAERYFAFHRNRMSAGLIEATTLSSKAYIISHFIKWVGPKGKKPDSAKNELNGMRFAGFCKHLNTKWTRGDLAFGTAKTLHQGVVQFYKWAWRNEHIDNLPRNLDSPELKWSRYRRRRQEPTEIQIFSNTELHTIISNAYDSGKWCDLRLFILLGINCGMTPIDIGNIRWNQITKANGNYYLEQTRSKTGVKGKWLLWDETIRYFNQRFGSIDHQSNDLIFITQQGRKLNRVMDAEPERFANFDDTTAISNTTLTRRFSRLIRRTYPDQDHYLSFKYLRKTGATLISHLDINNADRIAQIYLRHSLSSVADRHYVQPQFESLSAALAKLGAELGFHKV